VKPLRRSPAAFAHAVLVAVSMGCSGTLPPKGQIVLWIDTDAPLPAAQGALTNGPTPLFDRARVDVYPPGASTPCAGCTTEIDLDTSMVDEGRASLGIMTAPGASGYVARVRLYLAARQTGSEPSADSVLDEVLALPVVRNEGIVEVSTMMSVDSLGAPSGTLDAPGTAASGRVTSGHAGTWAGAAVVDCGGDPPAGAVCIHGGAFWMGNPLAGLGNTPDTAADVQRIVALSPFFLDGYEVTAGQMRTWLASHPAVTAPGAWSGNGDGSSTADWCTYGGAHDKLPVNCVSWSAARAYCEGHGGDLPTEAQLEYALGGLTGGLYVWGSEDPRCADAVFGRAGWGDALFQYGSTACRSYPDPGAPLDARRLSRADRDQLTLAGGVLYDLAGNLAEWALDAFQPQDGSCWGPGLFQDPSCGGDGPASRRSIRGGGWTDSGGELRAAHRYALSPSPGDLDVGFRCAYADAQGP
jgi:sulfatase modifying factor 1